MIREYEGSDWKEVCRVFNAAKPLELATAGVEASFVPLEQDEPRLAAFARSTVIVWGDRGRVMGFAGYESATIGWLFVDPASFRRGIARALLREMVVRVGRKSSLWCMKANTAALALYLSEGFEIVEQRETQNGGLPCTAVKLSREEKEPNEGYPRRPAVGRGSVST